MPKQLPLAKDNEKVCKPSTVRNIRCRMKTKTRIVITLGKPQADPKREVIDLTKEDDDHEPSLEDSKESVFSDEASVSNDSSDQESSDRGEDDRQAGSGRFVFSFSGLGKERTEPRSPPSLSVNWSNDRSGESGRDCPIDQCGESGCDTNSQRSYSEPRNYCCFCGEECNPYSQACGRCVRNRSF